jgi:hypothetical protein
MILRLSAVSVRRAGRTILGPIDRDWPSSSRTARHEGGRT